MIFQNAVKDKSRHLWVNNSTKVPGTVDGKAAHVKQVCISLRGKVLNDKLLYYLCLEKCIFKALNDALVCCYSLFPIPIH